MINARENEVTNLQFSLEKKATSKIIKNHSNRRKPKVQFEYKGRKLLLTGQVAKSLKLLIEKKGKGITALEASSWALRLASYIHILRSKYCLNIYTVTEPHEWGWHARYILQDDVKMITDS